MDIQRGVGRGHGTTTVVDFVENIGEYSQFAISYEILCRPVLIQLSSTGPHCRRNTASRTSQTACQSQHPTQATQRPANATSNTTVPASELQAQTGRNNARQVAVTRTTATSWRRSRRSPRPKGCQRGCSSRPTSRTRRPRRRQS